MEKANQEPGSQNIDNYELPRVTPMADVASAVSFVDAHELAEQVAQEHVADDEVEAIESSDLDSALNAAKIEGAQSGTVAFEMNYCIDRFNGDRAAHKDETKYRLGCLRDHASESEVAKIDAILAAIG